MKSSGSQITVEIGDIIIKFQHILSEKHRYTTQKPIRIENI